MKPGYKTTEFWGAKAVQTAALIAALAGSLSPRWAIVGAAVSEGLYAIGRGLAKAHPPKE